MRCSLKQCSRYAPVVLRIGLGAVLMWFSISQFTNPGAWVSFIPGWVSGMFGISSQMFVFMNATAELLCALAMVSGVYVRWAALLMSLHLFGITVSVGNSATGARDFGLAVALLALAMSGSEEFDLE